MMMKKTITGLLLFAMLLSLTACGGSSTQNTPQESGSASGTVSTLEPDDPATAPNDTSTPVENRGTKMLVAFFSLTGEQYEVGVIEKGNTHIVADMIAEQTGADSFQIEGTAAYPETYDGLLEISRQEEAADTRPEISGTVDNMEDYDVIFLGYPIWWGDMPMIVYGFLESYDFSGKTIVPFCTHGGSGLSSTPSKIAEICPDAVIADGLAVRGSTAQNSRETTLEAVVDWLKDGGFLQS